MAFLWHMEIREEDATGLQEAGSKITMTDVFRSEVNICKDIQVMSDTLFVPFAVSQHLMANNVM